ncbi:MAG: enolase C-terminal domain-like protein [Opitutaceae bacterium]
MTRITRILARTVPLRAEISNALVNFAGMTGSVVALVAERKGSAAPVVGYGFGSIGRYAQTEMILERFAPRILDADPGDYCDNAGQPDPVRMQAILRRNEKPGGHGERSVAVGAVDMAAWDLAAKVAGRPLASLLAGRFSDRPPATEVEVYAAGGYYHADGGLESLKAELTGYLRDGFKAVKIKIGGAEIGEDLQRVETAIEVTGDPGRVAVDANGRFGLDEAMARGAAMAPYGLRWYEEAGDPLDFELQRALGEVYPHPMATGENLFSRQDVRNLLRHAGLRPGRDILQMDPGLSYGLPEYLGMMVEMKAFGWNPACCFPHGGNLFNLHVASGLGLGGTEAYPGVFAPFGGFGDEVRVIDGTANIPTVPGIGWETKPDLLGIFQTLI